MNTPLSTFQTPSKRIHLTLEDLGSATAPSAPSTPFTTSNTTNNVSSISRPIAATAGESADYKQELAKLMMRSKGTPYEKTLKKFVDNKLSEMERHEMERQNELSKLRINPESEEITLLNLSPNRFDSSQSQNNNQPYLPFSNTTQSNYQERLEEMSRPLERNKYKGPEVLYPKISTNHIGRQRPAPKLDEQDTDIYGHSYPSSHNALGASWSAIAPKASIGFSKVSTKDFQDWLKSNEMWAEKTERKKLQAKIKLQNDSPLKPKIIHKSIKLADLAQRRESSELISKVFPHLLPTSPSHIPGGSVTSTHSLPHTPSHSRQHAHTQASMDNISVVTDPGVNVKLGVYDRLSLRGRVYAEKRRTYTPPPRTESFSPVISAKSREIARARQQRSMSNPPPPTHTHTQSSPGQSLPLKRSLSINSNANVSPYPPAPAHIKVYEERGREKLKVRKDRDMREALALPSQVKHKIAISPNKPFHPTILAKETHAIMQKKGETFHDRNLHSVEKQLIRTVLASRSPSPGPGTYTYAPVPHTQHIHTRYTPPNPCTYTPDLQYASPGYRGYTFPRDGSHRNASPGKNSHSNNINSGGRSPTTSRGGEDSSSCYKPYTPRTSLRTTDGAY